MSEFVSPIDDLRKALKALDWCRAHHNKTDDAIEWLESSAREVVDLYKPETAEESNGELR